MPVVALLQHTSLTLIYNHRGISNCAVTFEHPV